MELKRVIRWAISNGVIVSIFIMGTVYSAPGFRYMIPWICGTYLCLSMYYFSDETQRLLKEKGTAVPYWVDISIDLMLVYLLAYYNLPVSATMYLFHLVIAGAAVRLATKGGKH